MQISNYGLQARQIIGGSSHGNHREYVNHYKQLQKLLDAYKTRQASIEFRRNVIQKQKKNNYQLEYDRIRNQLGSHLVPHTTKQMIKDRMKELEKLGASAINKIID